MGVMRTRTSEQKRPLEGSREPVLGGNGWKRERMGEPAGWPWSPWREEEGCVSGLKREPGRVPLRAFRGESD